MNPSRLQDVSLYELALSAEQPPQPLQVSPTIFKSMVSTILDLLIDQKVPATLWMKLPRGEAWQSEIDRYRRSATAPHELYILRLHKEEGAIDQSELSGFAPVESAFIDDQSLVGGTSSEHSSSFFLPLSAETRLRREYFLLVVSAEFTCLVLAHRPRSVRSKDGGEAQDVSVGSTAKSNGLSEEELERKHPLLGLCSFDADAIQRVLEGMGQAIKLGRAEPEAKAAASVALSKYKLDWAPSPTIFGHFFTKQIQRQEEIWRSSAIYRKQAEASSQIQADHETMLSAIRLKDEFLKNVGQELRTPLTTMKTALSLLNSPTIKPAQRQRYMDMLTQECDRQSSLITSVLDLVQLEEVNEHMPMQPLRLSEIVPGVVSTYQPLAQEKGVMLAYTVPEELPPVSSLNHWLRQIVINLLHNGIKFTPTGGKVWVRAKQQGHFVELEFRDTGIGIPQAEIPKVFDRFYRVRQSSGEDPSGAGLGLSIVQQLLMRCGGSISVKSKPGEGSTFSVLLPIYH
jgi:two-component system, OmpR family, phosphate regulon sensor histidine kinase PhoR